MSKNKSVNVELVMKTGKIIPCSIRAKKLDAMVLEQEIYEKRPIPLLLKLKKIFIE